ncbi:proopiomelanocortin b isoform X2 [Tachysurus fulvidraco]|nr:proopiomelanocortin b isoform X2 [Tachysurus fulvidraco]XP_027011152.1 proopiomelanocortin b isoform X2 [Tachysurus fulvidraco]
MQCVSWLSAVFVLCVWGSAADRRCLEITDCKELGSRDKITECVWQCRLKQLVSSTENLLANLQQSDEEEEEEEEDEDSMSLGVLLSALSPYDASHQQLPSVRPQRSEERPSYSMEHFRWGKPASRKRRPLKAHVSEEDKWVEEPSMETPLSSLNRRQLEGSDGRELKNTNNKSTTTKYRITHFRWSAPPTAKRYGGFMKPWAERSHKPLLTLIRNIMVKNGH